MLSFIKRNVAFIAYFLICLCLGHYLGRKFLKNDFSEEMICMCIASFLMGIFFLLQLVHFPRGAQAGPRVTQEDNDKFFRIVNKHQDLLQEEVLVARFNLLKKARVSFPKKIANLDMSHTFHVLKLKKYLIDDLDLFDFFYNGGNGES